MYSEGKVDTLVSTQIDKERKCLDLAKLLEFEVKSIVTIPICDRLPADTLV